MHHAIINTFEPYFAQWSENPSEKVKKIVSKKSVHIFRQLLDNIFNLTCEVLPTVHRDLLKVRYTIKMNNHFFFSRADFWKKCRNDFVMRQIVIFLHTKMEIRSSSVWRELILFGIFFLILR